MRDRGDDRARMAPDDPLRALIVDRVERADGRYLLYYRWAGADTPAQPPATSRDGAQDEDV